ncbi:helix-turn-helix transcriptional regulator [Clostridium cochlearium]|uniref:helix-turn-helix transcriptional regulator n=1 Tax=Clostridium cochlearium TaxID=1494 RepID=UPI002149AB56|nr:helix-turn-helix transcriptional regulator [Clostridium cochlearium]MCR1971665.1 helix-turn-helix transcriptional regulator [Clostridium cochlearium]
MLSQEKMKFLRVLHNISQKELAKEIGCTRNHISMVENRNNVCTEDFYQKYIKAIYKISQAKNEVIEDKVAEVQTELNKINK